METNYQIINEYGILKKILSNLTCHELIKVSKVNTDWEKVANIIIKDNNKIITYIKEQEKWPELNKNIYPKLMIYSNDTDKSEARKLFKKQLPEIQIWRDNYYEHTDYTFLYLSNWKFINTIKVGNEMKILHSHCDADNDSSSQPRVQFHESLMLIPNFENFKPTCRLASWKDLNDEDDKGYFYNQLANVVWSYNCCIILTTMLMNTKNTTKVIKNLINDVKSDEFNHNRVITMAGGIAQFMMGQEKDERGLTCSDIAVIGFDGIDISSKTFVIAFKDDLIAAFTKMSNEVGPLEPGYKRIAFAFICVERYNVHFESETEEFAKFFPGVPLHGFWSYGEFCLNYSSLSDQKKKSKNNFSTADGQQFYFQRSSTYLIVTFKD